MKNMQIKKLRKFTRKTTKEALKDAFKMLLVKWYIYSYNELYRLWLEYREIEAYFKPYVNIKEVNNHLWWWIRKKMFLSEETKKILNQTISELIVYEDKKSIDLINLLFCNKKNNE